MKNPNGFGTVYKLSGKRRKKWRAVKTVGWEKEKQKRITIGYFESKSEAMEALGKYIYNPNAKLTIKDVYKMWSEKHFERVSKTRVQNIISIYNHIKKIEDICITNITLQELQNFIDELEISSGTLSFVKTVLNMIFEYALKNDFIIKNPVKFIELGRYKKVYEKKEFTQEEIDILWDNLSVPFVDTILILIYTGMRIGEMLNLKAEHINLEKKNIYISQSKTNSGIRYIPINNKIMPLIINLMKNKKNFLIEEKNKEINYNVYRRKMKKIFNVLNIYQHTPHECRHTTATLLSNAGANPISIAKIMGHADYNSMTAKVYTHKNEKELEKAISVLN